MNYTGFNLTQLHMRDFIIQFEKENPNVKWKNIQQNINDCFRKVIKINE